VLAIILDRPRKALGGLTAVLLEGSFAVIAAGRGGGSRRLRWAGALSVAFGAASVFARGAGGDQVMMFMDAGRRADRSLVI